MAKKSKEFKELLKQQAESPANSQKRLEKFSQELQQRSLGATPENIVINPVGEKKMSEVLVEFIQPYFHTVKNAKQYNKLIKFAGAAWNITFLPEEEQEKMIDKTIKEGMKYADKDTKQDALKMLKYLIARKIQYFADEQRLIVDFKLTETANQYHLSVASALTDQTNKK